MYKERKETTHGEIGEYTSIYIEIKYNTMYVKRSQGQYTRDNVSKIERKEKIQESSLHPSIYTPPKKRYK